MDDRAAWKAVLDLYHQDKVVEALDLIRRTGVGEAGAYLGWYRLIEAEAISRPGSTITRLASFLEVEWLPDETPGGIDRHARTIEEACARVSRALRFAHGPPVRIAFLSEAANSPWALHPYGYCIDMTPYDKICLPSNVLANSPELLDAVAHEYAHVAVLNASRGKAARWLDEAIAMQFDSHPDLDERDAFTRGESEWLGVDGLESAFGSADETEVWLAYMQSLWIGRRLRAAHGEDALGRVIRAIGEDHILEGFVARLLGRTPEDHALRKVVKESADVVNRAALQWLEAGSPNDPGPYL